MPSGLLGPSITLSFLSKFKIEILNAFDDFTLPGCKELLVHCLPLGYVFNLCYNISNERAYMYTHVYMINILYA